MDLKEVNLNQFLCLRYVLELQSVTKAAEKLAISQSAVSHNLNKLRSIFNDKLVVKGTGGIALTPKAETLFPHLIRLFQDVQNILTLETTFSPQETRMNFTVLCNDYFESTYLTKMYSSLVKEAPHASFNFFDLDFSKAYKQLESGEADIMLGVSNELYPGILRREVFSDSFLGVARKDHPLFSNSGSAPSLDDFISYPHLLVSPKRTGESFVDRALKKEGKTRFIQGKVSKFQLGINLVGKSDSLICLPKKVFDALGESAGVRSFKIPLEIEGFRLGLFFHEKKKDHLAHAWLRNFFIRKIQAIEDL